MPPATCQAQEQCREQLRGLRHPVDMNENQRNYSFWDSWHSGRFTNLQTSPISQLCQYHLPCQWLHFAIGLQNNKMPALQISSSWLWRHSADESGWHVTDTECANVFRQYQSWRTQDADGVCHLSNCAQLDGIWRNPLTTRSDERTTKCRHSHFFIFKIMDCATCHQSVAGYGLSNYLCTQGHDLTKLVVHRFFNCVAKNLVKALTNAANPHSEPTAKRRKIEKLCSKF